MSNFEEVGNFMPTWNPRWSGSKKGGDLKTLTAGDDSYMEGYYISTRDHEINGDPVKIHKMRITKAGNPNHVTSNGGVLDIPEGGVNIEFVGTGVINGKLIEQLNGGEFVQIKWKGKVENKKDPNRPYHDWFLGIDRSAEPLNVKSGHEIASVGASEESVGNPPFVPGEDDDLPF